MTYALAVCYKQDRQIYLLVIYPCFLFGLRLLCSTNQCFCWMIIPLLLCRLLYYPRMWHGILRCLLLRFVSDVSHRSWKTVYSDILLFTTRVISDSCLSTCFSLFPVEGGTKIIIFSRNIKKNLVYSCPFTYTRPFPIRKMTNCMVSVKAFAEEEIHEGVEIVKRPAGLASVPKVQEKRQERKKKKCTINWQGREQNGDRDAQRR